MLVFSGEGKTGVPDEKPIGARERTNNKLNPHMVSTPGFEPWPHCWEASALTHSHHTTLAPQGGVREKIKLSIEFHNGRYTNVACWQGFKEPQCLFRPYPILSPLTLN